MSTPAAPASADGSVPDAPATVVPANPATRAQVVTPAKPAAKPAPTKPAPAKTHRVGSGENLTAIARRYQCDMKLLISANNLDAPRYAIRPGQVLKLEGCGK